MTTKKRKGWQGNTIPVAAAKLGMGQSQVRRAVDRGEIKVVTFAGLDRIPNSEIERIAKLLELDSAQTADEEGRAA